MQENKKGLGEKAPNDTYLLLKTTAMPGKNAKSSETDCGSFKSSPSDHGIVFPCFLFIDIPLLLTRRNQRAKWMSSWVHWARRHAWSLPANTQSLNLISLSSSRNTRSFKRYHSQQNHPHLTRIRSVIHQVLLLEPNKSDSSWSVWLRWKGTYSLRACVRQDSSLRLLRGIMTELELPATSRKTEKTIIQRLNGFILKASSDVRGSWYSVNIFMSWCALLSFDLCNFWTLNCSFLISCVLLTEQSRYHPLLELSSFFADESAKRWPK